MKRFNYYTANASQNQADPTTAANFYNYMNGKWRFGDRTVFGGTGFPGSVGATSVFADYMFPGDSDTLNWGTGGVDPGFKNWSEQTNNNPAGDRRFVQSAGPFTLRPGAVNNITVGIVYARSTEGDLLASVRSLKRADTKAQALFDNCFRILEPPSAPKLTIQELNRELILMIENPSTSNNKNEKYIEEDFNIPDPDNGAVIDKNYRFEGYQIYQMKSKDGSIADIGNTDKARLVAQCDVKNSIKNIINFEFDEELGFSIPTVKVNAENRGIKHSFKITEDQFATGERRLVNFKQYYYIAVAYAYNNYKTYNPNDANALDGQKMPYLSSRNSFDGSPIIASEAMPSNIRTRNIEQNSVYGSTPKITRLDGRGNGNRFVDLTSASRDSIIQSGFYKTPTYDYGKGPLNIKVVDPLNLAKGYFECKFRGYKSETLNEAKNNKGIDTANWIIYRYDKKGGALLDSVTSEVSILNDNEQIIPQWGVSVQIFQNQYYFNDISKINSTDEHQRFTDPINATMTFQDSSKKWLSGIYDRDDYTPFNWIRSGTNTVKSSPNDSLLGIYNPQFYGDQTNYYSPSTFMDPDKKYTKLLNGMIAPHCLVGFEGEFMPISYPISSTQLNVSTSNHLALIQGFRSEVLDHLTISRINNVDIVITSDTSLWTRCAVIELGKKQYYTSLPKFKFSQNEGSAISGTLRNKPSVNKLGQYDGSGTKGLSWFPGYAIDVETGMRLHMAFGENSFLGGDNGRDLIWNPSNVITDAEGNFHFGGQHPIYVFGVNVNGNSKAETNCPYYDGKNNWVYDKLVSASKNFSDYRDVYRSLVWVVNPVSTTKQFKIETECKISVRVNKEFNDFTATGLNNGRPMYGWEMDEVATSVASKDRQVDALSLINVVPNPYYAFSTYEKNRLDTKVKITNLPENCVIKIYNISGKLIRTFKKSSPLSYVDWDLKNSQAIPIASGVYLIHVEVEGVGSTVIKFFGGMRQIDLETI